MQQQEKNALRYHSDGRPGKTEVIPTKPVRTPEELALAYSPGATAPAAGISRNHWNAYKYTNKGNLVAVISNGSCILDNDAIDATAAKPLLEGRSMLFKIYADIDAFDIEIAEEQSDRFIQTVHSMAPTFGAINLAGIKAPQCYQIEQRLRNLLDIPVIHDSLCGRAVCTAAAIINATEFACKKVENLKIVQSGCDTAITEMLLTIDVKQNNITILEKSEERDLSKAIEGSDVFIGISKENRIDEEALLKMAHDPIILLLTKQSLGIEYEKARRIRHDTIFAACCGNTPNLINDTIAFPYIFRGALDTLATTINSNMLLAAAKAIARLAHRPVPTSLQKRGKREYGYGREYFMPLPNDRRLATDVSVAVAKAAMDSGIARRPINDWSEYCNMLLSRLEREYSFYSEHLSHHRSSQRLHQRYSRAMPSITL